MTADDEVPAYGEQDRPEPPHSADELGTLLGFLDFLRASLAWKTDGLSTEELRLTLPPSDLTLGGMLAHMSFVEDFWFAHTAAEAPMPEPWASTDWAADEDADWHLVRTADAAALRDLWKASTARSRAQTERMTAGDAVAALGQTHPAWGGRAQVSLRWILTHMVEEYARHLGHADLIRQSVDGLTGE
ncbi:DinB family protein [Brevibacterium album]|uniref:DinB family protein n=1 Tax=Brevibacterium album TaxID=417948 RepID=UPI0003FC5AE0|nr:DinB family protein [Brevibacterium album]